jgi:hypothetical protein
MKYKLKYEAVVDPHEDFIYSYNGEVHKWVVEDANEDAKNKRAIRENAFLVGDDILGAVGFQKDESLSTPTLSVHLCEIMVFPIPEWDTFIKNIVGLAGQGAEDLIKQLLKSTEKELKQ